MQYHDATGRLQLARERAAGLARDYERQSTRSEQRGSGEVTSSRLASRILIRPFRRRSPDHGSASRA